jgi:hypothetical protein
MKMKQGKGFERICENGKFLITVNEEIRKIWFFFI